MFSERWKPHDRRDLTTWLAVHDEGFEIVPMPDWPEPSVRRAEVAWDFYLKAFDSVASTRARPGIGGSTGAASRSAPELGALQVPLGALLGPGGCSLWKAHRALLVDLEIGVLTRAGGSRVEVVTDSVDRIRLPYADGHRLVL